MDKDRIKCAAQQIKGVIEKTVGKMVDNKDLESNGKIDEAAGTVRKSIGEAKDVVRDVVDDRLK